MVKSDKRLEALYVNTTHETQNGVRNKGCVTVHRLRLLQSLLCSSLEYILSSECCHTLRSVESE